MWPSWFCPSHSLVHKAPQRVIAEQKNRSWAQLDVTQKQKRYFLWIGCLVNLVMLITAVLFLQREKEHLYKKKLCPVFKRPIASSSCVWFLLLPPQNVLLSRWSLLLILIPPFCQHCALIDLLPLDLQSIYLIVHMFLAHVFINMFIIDMYVHYWFFNLYI